MSASVDTGSVLVLCPFFHAFMRFFPRPCWALGSVVTTNHKLTLIVLEKSEIGVQARYVSVLQGTGESCVYCSAFEKL